MALISHGINTVMRGPIQAPFLIFVLKDIKYYQTRQIGVGPPTDIQQIGMVDTE